MFFDIKTLYWLLHQDAFNNNKPGHEPEEENAFFNATETLEDGEMRDNLDRLYIDCKNALLELGFIDGFRMAVALMLDNGEETTYDRVIKVAKGGGGKNNEARS